MEAQSRSAVKQQIVVPLHHRRVHVNSAEAIEFQIEVRRNHADNREFLAVERKALANHVRLSAQLPLPEARANHRHRSRANLVVASHEISSRYRLHSQN